MTRNPADWPLAERLTAQAGFPALAQWVRVVSADPAICALANSLPEHVAPISGLIAALRVHLAETRPDIASWLLAQAAEAPPQIPDAKLRDLLRTCLAPADRAALLHSLRHWDHHPPETEAFGALSLLLSRLDAADGPIAVYDIGASAGLSLCTDLYPLRLCAETMADAPFDYACLPGHGSLAMPEIALRRGVDLAPLACRDMQDARRIDAMTWARPERIRRRLKTAVELTAQHGGTVDRADAVEWLDALAPDSGCHPILSAQFVVGAVAAPEAARLIDAISRTARRLGASILRIDGQPGHDADAARADLFHARTGQRHTVQFRRSDGTILTYDTADTHDSAT